MKSTFAFDDGPQPDGGGLLGAEVVLRLPALVFALGPAVDAADADHVAETVSAPDKPIQARFGVGAPVLVRRTARLYEAPIGAEPAVVVVGMPGDERVGIDLQQAGHALSACGAGKLVGEGPKR